MNKYYWIVFIFCGLQPVSVKTSFAQIALEQIFANPPVEAKPRGYWLWPHGNFDYTRIKEELHAFQEMGLAGVDIFDMGIKDPLSQIPPGNRTFRYVHTALRFRMDGMRVVPGHLLMR